MDILNCDVAVVGAGTAGLAAWRAATAEGARAVIVERGPGGTVCARAGCMPSKLMLTAAKAAEGARRAGEFGVRTGPVAVDGAAVLARVRRERDHFVQGACQGWWDIPEDQRLSGVARFVGPTTLMVDDRLRVEARAVVIATGATPKVPDALAPVAALVRTHETIFDIEALPRRLAVLGAGPLGLELAQAFAWLGVDVSVFDPGDGVAQIADPEAAAAARDAFGRVVSLHLGAEVERAALEDGRARLKWKGGGDAFDLVLAASGRPPEYAGLALEAAGLALDDQGAPLFDPETRRCGDAPVFVAGDAGAYRPVLHEAARGGAVAGACAAGGPGRPQLPELSLTFTEPGVALVGTGFGSLPDGHRIGTGRFDDNGRARIEARRDGMVRLYADAGGRLVGATVLGEGAEHLGQLLALAVLRGMTAAELADAPLYHPTAEEAVQMAARELAP